MKAIGITAGIGSMLIGARNAGFEIVGSTDWRKYYHYRDARGRNTFEMNFPEAVFKKNLGELTPDELKRFEGADIALGHPESFRPDVPVFTSKGWVPIGKVYVGDLVLTHRGRFRRVYKVIHYKALGGTEEITFSRNTRKSGASLVTTGNHPILMEDGSWRAARDVRKGESVTFLSIPCPVCSELTPVSPTERPTCYCIVRNLWKGLTKEERKKKMAPAYAGTRRKLREGLHDFTRTDVRRKGQIVQFASFKIAGLWRSMFENGEPLCNLGVEEDESYIAKGFVVHNCGNFSNLSGANVGMGHDHRKEPMDIPLFCDLVARLRPRFFVMDDLPRSLDAFTMEQYHEKLPDYDLFPEWISNWGYGNIQKNRNRMFMIGALRGERFVFHPGEISNPLTLLDVIGGIPPGTPNHIKHTEGGHSPRARCAALPDKFWTWREVADRFMEHPPGWSWTYKKPDGNEAVRIGFLRTHEKYSHVLTGQNSTCHPLTGYPFTLRERARIQGFPDNFIFYSEKVDDNGEWCHEENIVLIRQTGKAMPVQFCQYVSEQVKAHIEGREFKCSEARIIKPHEHVNFAKQWYCKNVGYAANQEGACSACWKSRTCTAREPQQINLFDSKAAIVRGSSSFINNIELELPDSCGKQLEMFPPSKKKKKNFPIKQPKPLQRVESKDLSFGGEDGD